MDTKEFSILAGEVFEAIERALETSPLDDIEPLIEGPALHIRLPHDARISLVADAATHTMHASDGATHTRFAYHPVEEQWFEHGSQLPLTRWVERQLAARLGTSITLAWQDR